MKEGEKMYIPSTEAEVAFHRPNRPSKVWVTIQTCGLQILPEHDGKPLLLQYGEFMAVRRATVLKSGVIFATMNSPASLVYFSNEELAESGMKLVGVVKRIGVDMDKEKHGADRLVAEQEEAAW